MQTRAASGWKVITLHSDKGLDAVGKQFRVEIRRIHSGTFGGVTQLVAQGASDIQTQKAGKYKSLSFVVYLRGEERGQNLC